MNIAFDAIIVIKIRNPPYYITFTYLFISVYFIEINTAFDAVMAKIK